MPRARRTGCWLLIIAMVMVGASCGDDGDDEGAPSTIQPTETATSVSTSRAPVVGGSITIGQAGALRGFDPTRVQNASVSVGGIELQAFYDRVLRWNVEARKYEPRTAQSFESNSELTRWTLKLKPSIKFSDGTDYNAEAVKFNVERHMAADSTSTSRGLLQQTIASIDVVDALTVDFQLKQLWSGLPYLFTREVGLIASPAAIQAAGANFHTAPGNAGAGAFLLSSFKPGESVVFTRNPNFYGGQVYLDQVTFASPRAAQATYDSLTTGSLHGAFFRDPTIVKQAQAAGFSYTLARQYGGSAALMNSGTIVTCRGGQPANLCAGQADGAQVQTKTPTADVRVRRAVAAALDPNVINARVWEGNAEATTAVFTKDFPWDPGVPGPQYDPARASQLVQEAKAAGWDGKIRVLAANDPLNAAWGLSVTTLLRAVGMEVDFQNSKDIAGVVTQFIVQKDFDVAATSLGLSDDFDSIFIQMTNYFRGPQSSGRYGFANAKMDAAIDALGVAATDEQRKSALKSITEVLASEVPAVPIAVTPNAWIYTSKLQGVQTTSVSVVLLDKAWLER